jgi:L-ascorbate metabolism protein UlaG (beta-lactamase superfamily)
MEKLMTIRSVAAAGVLALASTLVALSPGPAAAQALQGDSIPTDTGGPMVIHPLYHATFVISWNGKVIYVDPSPAPGAAQGSTATAAFKGLPAPNIILVTDIHGDHFSAPSLSELAGPNTRIVAPQSVIDQMPEALKARTTAVANGQTVTVDTIPIEGVPMYNITADRLKFHEKGRGNGYVVTLGGRRVYIAGDTEAIPEMKALKGISVAFVPMNLPYTMTPEQAAEGVLAFKPAIVYPYHSRGSDTAVFAQIVGADKTIEVRQRNWYP